MLFKFDLHTHSFFSSDGVSAPEDLIAVARKKGLHGLAITDHNSCESVDYLLEKGLMREDGKPVDDFLLLPGVEVTTAEGHLLCLGTKMPDMRGKPASEVCRVIHELGGLAIPPHPYDRFRAGIREAVLDTLEIDAIEVFNAATTLDRHNRRARDFADREGIGMIASSDAHHADVVGSAFTVLELKSLDQASVLAAVPDNHNVVSSYIGWGASLRKTAGFLRSILPGKKSPRRRREMSPK